MQECVVLFYWGKVYMLDYEEKDIEIKCPICRTKLLDANSKKDKVYQIVCRKCRKWIWINPTNGKYQIKQIPKRATASGTRFY